MIFQQLPSRCLIQRIREAGGIAELEAFDQNQGEDHSFFKRKLLLNNLLIISIYLYNELIYFISFTFLLH